MPVNLAIVDIAGQDAFGDVIFINPLVSNPSAPIYQGRGVQVRRPVDVVLESGAVLSSLAHTVRLFRSEYLVEPVPGDQVSFDGGLSWELIDDTDPDSGFGLLLTLKAADA
jgi:hypothetical protein